MIHMSCTKLRCLVIVMTGLATAAMAAAASSPPPLEPPPKPVPDPRRPRPYFSWDTIPLAFHGANRSGLGGASRCHFNTRDTDFCGQNLLILIFW